MRSWGTCINSKGLALLRQPEASLEETQHHRFDILEKSLPWLTWGFD